MKRALEGTVLVLLIMGTLFLARFRPLYAAQDARSEPIPATITGQSYCLLKALLGEEPNTETETTQQAFRVTLAKNAAGDAIPEMVGWTLHYLQDDMGKRMASSEDFRNKILTVKGRIFNQERVVQVTKVVYASEPAASYDFSETGSMSGRTSRQDDDYAF
ncbi:MAG TPA: hypothetical protein HPP77_03795 [Candidatus Hydrogenedentes bacterium]|nr:hypothetical protein [Candidatus Hydrogenedentota bacterium]HIJ73990.1 hypothetical protein [Candidatus Hydrogenedentota bacterium]